MKKETFIAIFFGVAFGAVVSIFLLMKNKEFQLTKSKTIAPTQKTNKVRSGVVANIKSLEILEPNDGAVFEFDSVKIKGTAEKDSLIIVQSPIKELAVNNTKGQFSLTFPLSLGANVINITVYSKDNQIRPQEKQLNVYYLDEEI